MCELVFQAMIDIVTESCIFLKKTIVQLYKRCINFDFRKILKLKIRIFPKIQTIFQHQIIKIPCPKMILTNQIRTGFFFK